MKLKLRINGKMLLYILGTTIVVYVSSLGYAALKLRSNSYKNAHQILESKTTEISNEIQQKLTSYTEPLNILAHTFSNFNEVPEAIRRELFSKMLYNILDNNPEFSSVFSLWEPASMDGLDDQFINSVGSTILGNFNYRYYRQGESIVLDNYIEADSSKIFISDVYSHFTNSSRPLVTDPSFYSYSQDKKDEMLIVKMVIPIIIDDNFMGIVGADIPMDYLQQAYSKLKPMVEGKMYIMTPGGEFLAHPETNYLGKLFADFAPDLNNEFNVHQVILDGGQMEFLADDPISGKTSIFKISPIAIGNSEKPWSMCISVPLDTLYQSANSTFRFVMLIGIMGLIIISLVIFGIAKSISNPIIKTTRVLEEISRGNIRNVEMTKFVFNDEINDMAIGMNNVVQGLNSAAMFAQQIGEGYLNVDYKLLSEKDALGISLITMQESLKKAKMVEDAKRVEDEKLNWVTHGLAKFGEIIRQNNDNMDKFTMNITKNIVDYVGCAQAALYINQQIEDDGHDNDTFELKAVIAYGKPVMLNKTFERGQELLGRVVSENKTLYLENLPERYVMLSPGMKDKRKPNNLLLSPLHINDNTLGIIELLSYDAFGAHHIDFIEKLCENIASVVASVKTNLRTEKLLQQSQHQADELAQHEEEMRQNLEEMEATQEEANKRQNELNSYLKAVKNSVMSAELDTKGRILDVSSALCVVYGATMENMRGKYYDSFVAYDKTSQDEFTEFWENVIKNGSGKRVQKIKLRNKESWLLESYLVIKKDGLPPKILIVATDKTKEKEVNELLNSELKSHNMI